MGDYNLLTAEMVAPGQGIVSGDSDVFSKWVVECISVKWPKRRINVTSVVLQSVSYSVNTCQSSSLTLPEPKQRVLWDLAIELHLHWAIAKPGEWEGVW